ncbi:NUDIX domain-containing protein [Solibacillus sp. CAU 1738]|uniref:NUDIX domain-containing protein n=1 Tax=Solibacillus sp. CAU 1738 TaxID=3140363 RepID=UPI0032607FE8
MFTFIDENGYKVELQFGDGPFEIEPKHVLVLVKYDGKWLCAIHRNRGVEFPGGKQEPGETLIEAAIREVYEETKVHVSDVQPFAHYIVYDEKPFCKVVFTAKVKSSEPFVKEFETIARLWLEEKELLNHPNLSFYMQDDGMKKMLQEVKYIERQW